MYTGPFEPQIHHTISSHGNTAKKEAYIAIVQPIKKAGSVINYKWGKILNIAYLDNWWIK